jgi:Cof subfamily protein (haloacid dehalogenase superfamily)
LNEGLDVATARDILDYCEREGLQLNYYLNDTLFSAEETTWSDLYAARTGAVVNAIGDLHAVADQPPTKLLVIDEPARINRLCTEMQSRYAGRAYVTISNAEYLEFMPPGVNKGKALAVVAQYYGIPREKVIAFGDAGNDMPVIEWAGLGVAMENARPEAKAVADRIAPRYDEDGVAVVLEEIFGLTPMHV